MKYDCRGLTRRLSASELQALKVTRRSSTNHRATLELENRVQSVNQANFGEMMHTHQEFHRIITGQVIILPISTTPAPTCTKEWQSKIDQDCLPLRKNSAQSAWQPEHKKPRTSAEVNYTQKTKITVAPRELLGKPLYLHSHCKLSLHVLHFRL